jgi:excisionase family DNA binding protein
MRNGQRSEVGVRGGPSVRPIRPLADAITPIIPFAERVTCTIADACEATGLGRTKLYELIGEGALHTTTIGRRRLVLVSSLLRLLRPEGIKPS